MILRSVGNRIQTAKVEPLVPFIKSKAVAYSYDADNRIATITDGAVTYDANGSTESRTSGVETFSYSWNFDNRLSHWNDGIQNVYYLYDGRQNRLVSVRDVVTTRYVLDTAAALSSVLTETDDTGIIAARYIYGLGLILTVQGRITITMIHRAAPSP